MFTEECRHAAGRCPESMDSYEPSSAVAAAPWAHDPLLLACLEGDEEAVRRAVGGGADDDDGGMGEAGEKAEADAEEEANQELAAEDEPKEEAGDEPEGETDEGDGGADPPAAVVAMTPTPLMCIAAAARGHLAILKLLVEAGGDVEATDTRGRTPLLHAAMSRDLETVQWLVSEAKANVEAADGQGMTALLHAAANGDAEMVEWLVKGARPSLTATDVYGRTALQLAEELGQGSQTYTAVTAVLVSRVCASQVNLRIDHPRPGALPQLTGSLVGGDRGPTARGCWSTFVAF
jgi:ankyrin repeat protein